MVQKVDIKEVVENGVVFQDGSYERVDTILYCTGKPITGIGLIVQDSGTHTGWGFYWFKSVPPCPLKFFRYGLYKINSLHLAKRILSERETIYLFFFFYHDTLQ